MLRPWFARGGGGRRRQTQPLSDLNESLGQMLFKERLHQPRTNKLHQRVRLTSLYTYTFLHIYHIYTCT